MIKKFISLILTITVAFCVIPFNHLTVNAYYDDVYYPYYGTLNYGKIYLDYMIYDEEVTIENCWVEPNPNDGIIYPDNLIIPDMIDGYPVTRIGSSVFYGCELLTIIIPDSVTNIGSSAFSDCDLLTTITIPKNVTTIGENAFYNCSSLESINVDANNSFYSSQDGVLFNKDKTKLIKYPARNTQISYAIPNSVTEICEYAFSFCDLLETITISKNVISMSDDTFYKCGALESINVNTDNSFYSSQDGVLFNKDKTILIKYPACNTQISYAIPNSVTKICEYAFYNCQSLTTIEIPDSISDIGNRTFENCYVLKSIAIPDSVKYLGDSTFSNCKSLEAIVLPDSISDIGNGTFENCYALKSIAIPDSVKYLGYSTFSNCKSLEAIELPDSILTIDYGAFQYCSSLKTITIPDSTTYIGSYSFNYCTSLTSVIIGDAVTAIDRCAFYNCVSLNSLTMGKNVQVIGEDAFYNCNELSKVYITDLAAWCEINFEGESEYRGDDSYHITLCSNPLYFAGELYINGTLATDIVIPDSVKYINDYAFKGCTSITSVKIPDSVTSIGEDAFKGCSSLASVDIGNNVKYIGMGAFYGCSSLSSISINDSLNYIGGVAFEGCTSLKKVFVNNIATWCNISFNIYSKFISYSSGYYEYYYSSNPLYYGGELYIDGTLATDIVIPDSVTHISDCAFYGCTSITSVKIPNSVTSIGERAFSGCSSLSSIKLGDRLNRIGCFAFSGCTSLKKVSVNDMETWCNISFYIYHFKIYQGDGQYYEYYNYTSNPLYYSADLYVDDSLATDTIIPDSVETIKSSAFEYIRTIKSITILNPNCQGLSSASIPSDVTIIGLKNSTAQTFAEKNGNPFVEFISKIKGTSLTVGTDIVMNYYCEQNEDSIMKFTANNKETIVEGYYDPERGMYVYPYHIVPERMGENIKAEFITNGEIEDIKSNLSVLSYLKTVISKTADDLGISEIKFEKLKTLAYDMLHYGAAAQKYFDYKPQRLVNKDITGGTTFVAPTKTDKDVTNKSADGVTFTGQNLYFDSVNRLMFRFTVDPEKIADISKLSIKISDGVDTKTVTSADFEKIADNTYVVYSDDIYATEFDTVFTATANLDGKDGANVKYSVNSYVYAMCNKAGIDADMLELAKATYNYGISAKAYAEAQ